MARLKALRAGTVGRCLGVGTAIAGLAIGLSMVGTSAAGAAAPKSTDVTYAEQPGASPAYIFPFENVSKDSVYNVAQFQYLMYRPLYYFGKGATVTLNETLSLAKAPVYSNDGKTVTLTLKTYKWSDGEQVTTTDVMFFLNMYHSDPTAFYAYVPNGLSIPTSITGVTVTSPTKMKITLNQSYNTHWFTYNQLSQITPMPLAWTKTSASAAAGSGGCAKAAFGANDAGCKAVFTFLSEQAGFTPTNPTATNNALPTYATNPLWQVVDGPWHLTAFAPTGDITMAPNASYSGPVKPSIKKFTEKPYTSTASEFNALVGGQLNVGFLPISDITSDTTTPLKAGANNPRVSNTYSLDPLYTWSINYFPYNFNSTGDGGVAGKIYSQLYFRQAMQDLVDQSAYITHLSHGYGVPTYGPVPVEPKNSFASSYEKSDPYPYSPSKAKSLLEDHGWKVVPNGTDTCEKPGTASNECGAGIPSGAKLSFSMQYSSQPTVTKAVMSAEKSNWASVGIQVSMSSATFNTVYSAATPCKTGCSWEMANWGGGWVFSPDIYPTGEDLFATGAGSNNGSYSNPTNDKNIKATDVTSTKLTTYENFLAKELPVVYEPDWVTVMVETQKGLEGATPVNPLEGITPASWHWSKS